MTIPNRITLMRIALVPVFMVCMGFGWRVAALAVFAVAGVSDQLDGYLARKMGQITNIGKILDPLADKLLVLAALICFLDEQTSAAWVVAVVVARELIISSLRVLAAAAGTVMAADWSGKVKTTVQVLCIIVILTPWHLTYIGPIRLCDLAAWLIAAVTVWSGTDYLVRNRKLLIGMK